MLRAHYINWNWFRQNDRIILPVVALRFHFCLENGLFRWMIPCAWCFRAFGALLISFFIFLLQFNPQNVVQQCSLAVPENSVYVRERERVCVCVCVCVSNIVCVWFYQIWTACLQRLIFLHHECKYIVFILTQRHICVLMFAVVVKPSQEQWINTSPTVLLPHLND